MAKLDSGHRSTVNDLRVEIRCRNNVLYTAIFDRYGSVSAFCKAHESLKSAQSNVGKLLNLKDSPFKKGTKEFKDVALRVERALRIPAEDLFPAALYAIEGDPKTVIEMSSLDALPMGAPMRAIALHAPKEQEPDLAADRNLLAIKIQDLLRTPSYREREVLKLRYGLGEGNQQGYTYSLKEIGSIFKVNRERIRCIEVSALQKLQLPIRARELEPFATDLFGVRRPRQEPEDEPSDEDDESFDENEDKPSDDDDEEESAFGDEDDRDDDVDPDEGSPY